MEKPVDNTDLFTCKSNDYSKFRPSYPTSAIDWLFEKNHPCSHVLDIGAGTGIFTQALLCRFPHVSAVEPNADMRRQFLKSLPHIFCSHGTGENTGLPDASTDLITVAQAFHWLDAEKFKQEAERILHPGGKVAIVWNNSLENDFTKARNNVCRKYCPRFRKGHAGKRSAAEGDAFLRHSYFREVEVTSFPNPFVMDRRIFIGNMRSRSYALMPGDKNYGIFMKELNDVFNRFSRNGTVTDPLQTQIFLGRF